MIEDAGLADQSPPDKPKATAPESAPLDPVAVTERIAAVDVLRGFALLGILGMNIYAYALPFAAYFNPLAYGATTGVNHLTWKFTYLFFDLKFMAIFSMLFGAGLILMSNRAEAAGRTFAKIYYRRILWLLVIGLLHAYFLWWGDILFGYAICGLLLYPFRRRSAALLIVLGAVVLLIGMGMRVGGGTFFAFARQQATEAEAALAAGETPNQLQEQMKKNWDELRETFDPSPATIAEEVEAYRGGYGGLFKYRAPKVLEMQTQALVFFVFWRAAGMMLLGMGLMKLGVFSARRSLRFYITCIVLGYGLGLPLVWYGAGELMAHSFDFVYDFKLGGHYNYVGSVLIALGHLGLVMLVCRSALLSGLKRRLAAVGRMALTNYLMHTILLTPIFCGFGLGLFGQIDRFGLMAFVLGMWILQLLISPIWLKHFRFGPAEWLWRSLTYRRRQPMRLMQKDSL